MRVRRGAQVERTSDQHVRVTRILISFYFIFLLADGQRETQ